MKGPRSRHKFYIVRVWECPACKKWVFTPVHIVNRACTCQGAENPRWMCLIDETPGVIRNKQLMPPTENNAAATP